MINSDTIIRVVAEDFGLRILDLKGPKRHAGVARPRHVAMYLLRTINKESYPTIGKRFFGRDHTTALAACRAVEERLRSDPNTVDAVARIKGRLAAIEHDREEGPVGTCPHCARPFVRPESRDTVVRELRDEAKTLSDKIEIFARAS